MFQWGTKRVEKKNMPYLGLTESLSSGASVPSQWGPLQDTPTPNTGPIYSMTADQQAEVIPRVTWGTSPEAGVDQPGQD